jgi:hypothetical protein
MAESRKQKIAIPPLNWFCDPGASFKATLKKALKATPAAPSTH